MELEEFSYRAAAVYPALRNVAGAMLRNPHDADDAVQEALLKGWAALPGLRNPAKLEAWLIQITRRESLAILRKRKKEVPTERLPETITVEAPLPDVAEALGALALEDARMVRLHHEQGYPVAEISALLQMPESLVKVRLFRARRKLRTVLLALLVLLLAGAAIAASRFDVQYFFTQRRVEPRAEEQIQAGLLPIIEQHSALQWLDAEVTSAAWIEGQLAVTVEFAVRDTNHIALPQEARGVDGIRHDFIWWDGKITPLAEWLPPERTPVQFRAEAFGPAGTPDWRFSYDWLQEDGVIAYLLQYDLAEPPVGDLTLELQVLEGLGTESPTELGSVIFTVGGKAK